MAFYMDRGLDVKGVLDIEGPFWERLTIIDVENYVVCFNGIMKKFRENDGMSIYWDNVKTRPVVKATTNGLTLNLFIR